MSTYQIFLTRIRDDGNQTIGRLSIWENIPKKGPVFECVTLEPSWVLNENNISCIPCGKYTLVDRTSAKFGRHLHVKEVEGRSYILIHSLNYYKQTEGCIGVGRKFRYLDNDDKYDVLSSRDTLDDMLELLPESCTIEVMEHDKFQRFYNQEKEKTNSG